MHASCEHRGHVSKITPLHRLVQAVGTRGIPEDIQGAVRNQGELHRLQLPARAAWAALLPVVLGLCGPTGLVLSHLHPARGLVEALPAWSAVRTAQQTVPPGAVGCTCPQPNRAPLAAFELWHSSIAGDVQD